MDREELIRRAEAVSWWHDGIDLGHGVISSGVSKVKQTLLPRLDLPQDLMGKTVLDIGTWDGFMAWECERRNAAKVVAVDSYVWQRYGTKRAGFDLAHEALASRVIPVECEVMDLDPGRLGTFDIVLLLGVLYHMRHPLLALERAAAMTGELLIVETHVDLIFMEEPAMRYYPGRELDGDATNWWGPNPLCLIAMLNDVGFPNVRQIALAESQHGRGRMVVHASR